jgi:hypothetical protein
MNHAITVHDLLWVVGIAGSIVVVLAILGALLSIFADAKLD